MKVVGSVSPDEVPRTGETTFGLWTSLAMQAIDEHKKGRVLTVKVADQAEYKKLGNGVAEKLRQHGYARRFAAVKEEDGILVYMQLEPSKRTQNVVSVAPPPPPRRKAKNAS